MAVGETRRHVVLITDGRENIGDGVGEARVLHSAGTRSGVTSCRLQVPVGPDVRVDSVQLPSTVLPGARAQATAVLVSNETTTARVVWSLDNNQVVMDTVLRVKPGVTDARVLLPPAHSGFHQVNVEISPGHDSVQAGNDVGEALFQVLGLRQQVLVVAGTGGAGANVAHALAASGVDTEVVTPAQVPATVSGVARWQTVVLVDVSAAELGYHRMEALATATRDLGVGLAAFGGTNTYGPGGLAGTPLEQALPIDMRVANPQEKPPVAVMLVLESVESPAGDLVLRGAARRLVANLSPQDLVGVANGQTGVVVPLQPVGDGKQVERDIRDIQSFGDPPSYVPFMQDAASALAAHPGDTKYIVVLGDGDADDPLPTPSFMAGLVHQGITVSTVGADVHGVPQFMANMALFGIAAEGDGRFYATRSRPASSRRSSWTRARRSCSPGSCKNGSTWPPAPSRPPSMGSTRRPFRLSTVTWRRHPAGGSRVVRSGPAGDPILAQWQYGLGTALAWTSDTEGKWTAELLRSPLAGRLFAGIVAATLPLAASRDLSLSAQVEGDQAHLVAQVAEAPADTSAVAHVVRPDGQGSDIALAETAPGRFEGDIPTTEVGPYLMRVEVKAGERALDAATTGVAIAYSPELRFIGTDLPFLREVASAGGGVVLASARAALSQPVPPVSVTQSLAEWLLVLAAILLPVDVALRRLVIGRQRAAAKRGQPCQPEERRPGSRRPGGRWKTAARARHHHRRRKKKSTLRFGHEAPGTAAPVANWLGWPGR